MSEKATQNELKLFKEALELSMEIVEMIEDFLDKHPSVTRRRFREFLLEVWSLYELHASSLERGAQKDNTKQLAVSAYRLLSTIALHLPESIPQESYKAPKISQGES